MTPSVGNIFIHGYDFLHSDKNVQDLIMKKCGVLYQSGALFTSMTLAENVAIPLQQYTNYSKQEIAELVSLKLSLVGLSGFENFYPSEISGGMKKRALEGLQTAVINKSLILNLSHGLNQPQEGRENQELQPYQVLKRQKQHIW